MFRKSVWGRFLLYKGPQGDATANYSSPCITVGLGSSSELTRLRDLATEISSLTTSQPLAGVQVDDLGLWGP